MPLENTPSPEHNSRSKEVFRGFTPESYRENPKLKPSSESEERAASLLAKVTQNLEAKTILEEHLIDTESPLESLRANTTLRTRLGELFLETIEDIAQDPQEQLPPRVEENSASNLKSVPLGYPIPKMSSREYSALLALSMLDGTFYGSFEPSQVEVNAHGLWSDGQHRYTARKILERLSESTPSKEHS